MTVLPDTPDWLPVQQNTGEQLFAEANVNHPADYTEGPFYVAAWQGISFYFTQINITNLVQIEFDFYMDAGLTIQSGSFVYRADTVPLSDAFPVCGNFMKVLVTRLAGGDTPQITFIIFAHNTASRRTRIVANGLIIDASQVNIGAGGFATFTASQMLPGRAFCTVKSTQQVSSVDAQENISGATWRDIMYAQPAAGVLGVGFEFQVAQRPLRVVVGNGGGVNANIDCTVVTAIDT